MLRQATLQMVGMPSDDLDNLKQMAAHLQIPATHDADAAVSLLVLQTLIATHSDNTTPEVPDAVLDRAMRAPIPGGSEAWVWLFNCEGGMKPEDKHRDWFRRVLAFALFGSTK